MIVIHSGPTLAQLRQAIGTKDLVNLGDRKISMTVHALCAVGCDELPIDLPHNIVDQASVWYVAGELSGCKSQDYDPTVIALLAFDSEGIMTSGVVVVVNWNEEASAKANPGIFLTNVFAPLLRESIKQWYYYPEGDDSARSPD